MYNHLLKNIFWKISWNTICTYYLKTIKLSKNFKNIRFRVKTYKPPRRSRKIQGWQSESGIRRFLVAKLLYKSKCSSVCQPCLGGNVIFSAPNWYIAPIFLVQITLINEHLFCKYFVHLLQKTLLLMDVVILVFFLGASSAAAIGTKTANYTIRVS